METMRNDFGLPSEAGITILTSSIQRIGLGKMATLSIFVLELTPHRIIELLKQLFWKQNRYAANNNTYGHKASDSKEGSQDVTTPIPQAAPTSKKSNAPPGMIKLKLGNQQKAK
jgi:hypothetical protein